VIALLRGRKRHVVSDAQQREQCGGAPADADRWRGSERELIERALSYSLGARTELAFGADGVSCQIGVPLDQRPATRPAGPAESPA
jgi:hypothetical protein